MTGTFQLSRAFSVVFEGRGSKCMGKRREKKYIYIYTGKKNSKNHIRNSERGENFPFGRSNVRAHSIRERGWGRRRCPARAGSGGAAWGGCRRTRPTRPIRRKTVVAAPRRRLPGGTPVPKGSTHPGQLGGRLGWQLRCSGGLRGLAARSPRLRVRSGWSRERVEERTGGGGGWLPSPPGTRRTCMKRTFARPSPPSSSGGLRRAWCQDSRPLRTAWEGEERMIASPGERASALRAPHLDLRTVGS